MEKIMRLDSLESANLSLSESAVIFHLKNHSKLTYVLDFLTLKDVRRRLAGGMVGVLKMGETRDFRIDLNGVEAIIIDGEVIKR